jgi:hypothetical protein
MQMKLVQREKRLWISMGKAVAEGSGRLQGKLRSPSFRIDPQIDKE